MYLTGYDAWKTTEPDYMSENMRAYDLQYEEDDSYWEALLHWADQHLPAK